MKIIWLVMTTLRSTPKSDFPGPPNTRVFVEFYYSCNSIYVALETIDKTVEELGFSLERIQRCISTDLDDWDYEKYPETSDFFVFCKSIFESQQIGHGPFCFGSEQSGQ